MMFDDIRKGTIIVCYDDKDFLEYYKRATKSDFNIERDELLSMLNNEHEKTNDEFNNFVAFVIKHIIS